MYSEQEQDRNEAELVRLLGRRSTGMGLGEIHSALRDFLRHSVVPLDTILRHAVAKSVIYQKGAMFHAIDAGTAEVSQAKASSTLSSRITRYARDQPSVELERKQKEFFSTGVTQRRVVEVPRETKTFVVAPETTKIEVPPNGNLRRLTAKGVIAMMLYLQRDRKFSLDEVTELGGYADIKNYVYKILTDLVADNRSANPAVPRYFVVAEGTGRAARFQWSGHFNYPFSEVRSGDKALVKIDLPAPVVAVPAPVAVDRDIQHTKLEGIRRVKRICETNVKHIRDRLHTLNQDLIDSMNLLNTIANEETSIKKGIANAAVS